VRRKRLDLIISAIKQIPQKKQPILLLVGEVDNTFNDAFDLKDFNKKFIHILPFQKDMTLIYKGINAYISASELEGMSNSCLEAMSSGIPLIVSDISGQEELIGKNGEGGWIFKKGDVSNLKLAIESFYREWELNTIDKKKNWVRKMAIKKYDSRLWAQRYEILYNSLMLGKE
jgi:glycosyltransferase involved in cell wall biosynthesis